jgi:hypothetical protein
VAAAAPKKALSLYRHKLGWGGEQQEEFGARPNTRGDNHQEKGQSERVANRNFFKCYPLCCGSMKFWYGPGSGSADLFL